MKWKKLGKIFDPNEYLAGEESAGFAQSPQALVFDDFVRIYFSTRKKDPKNDKVLSHIAFVDMDKTLRNVLRVSHHEVIPLGKLGCFDEHGIFPMNVVRHGERILGYTCGWNRRVSVSVDTAIGFAESFDHGWTFQKLEDGPILASSVHEPFLVGDPFVRIYDGLFHMWYIYGTEWRTFAEGQAPDRIYKIAHAISPDGINWQREGRPIISDRLQDESQALPTVIDFGGSFHMFFCYRHSFDFRRNRSRAYRIGHASSSDLVHWVRNDEEAGIQPTEGDWDADMLCYPHVFCCDGKIFLLYNGSEFGRQGFGLAELEMPECDWELKINTAAKEQITIHLRQCADQFVPTLSQRVDILEYARKIAEKSVTFEAWNQEKLIGLIAAYFNDPEKEFGFITSVSVVDDCTGKGIAAALLNQCVQYAGEQGFKTIRLEVSEENSRAIRLYSTRRFSTYDRKAGTLYMKRDISREAGQ